MDSFCPTQETNLPSRWKTYWWGSSTWLVSQKVLIPSAKHPWIGREAAMDCCGNAITMRSWASRWPAGTRWSSRQGGVACCFFPIAFPAVTQRISGQLSGSRAGSSGGGGGGRCLLERQRRRRRALAAAAAAAVLIVAAIINAILCHSKPHAGVDFVRQEKQCKEGSLNK